MRRQGGAEHAGRAPYSVILAGRPRGAEERLKRRCRPVGDSQAARLRGPKALGLGTGMTGGRPYHPCMSCDVLVIAPHPDDAELHLGASIAGMVRRGQRVVVVDCTAGEGGSRGSAELRAQEAAASAQRWGLQARENLGLADGGLRSDDPEQRRILTDALRRHAPRWVLSIAAAVRHPDHRACHWLSRDAVKSAAIHGFATASGAAAVADLRLAFYEAELPIQPTLLIPAEEADVAVKRDCLACYHSQWGSRDGPATSISDPAFLRWIEHRGRTWGYHARSPYAEALISAEPLVAQLSELIG